MSSSSGSEMSWQSVKSWPLQPFDKSCPEQKTLGPALLMWVGAALRFETAYCMCLGCLCVQWYCWPEGYIGQSFRCAVQNENIMLQLGFEPGTRYPTPTLPCSEHCNQWQHQLLWRCQQQQLSQRRQLPFASADSLASWLGSVETAACMAAADGGHCHFRSY